MLIKDPDLPFNMYKRLVTVLFRDSETLYSKELMAHDGKTQLLMKTSSYVLMFCVLLMCKLKYKCIFM